jgi:hypothetical protein
MSEDNNIIDLQDYIPDETAVSVSPYINTSFNKLVNINNKDSLKEEDKEKTAYREKTNPYTGKEKNTKTLLKEFILSSDGQFSINDVMQECGLFSEKRNAVKCALSDFVKEGLIERQGLRSGTYSPIRGTGIKMNDLILNASTNPVELRLPLAIDALLNIYNRNLIVIQGLSNAGKTAFLLEIARLNRSLFDTIKYINTEMDASEIKDRVERRNIDLEEFLSYVEFSLVKSTHLSGAIRYEIEPNGLNLVDYLHLEDATLMATEMDKIQERLDNGIAVVAIQKYFGKDMGYGGHGVKNRARLVIDLSRDVVTLKKVKSPRWWHKEIRLDESYRRFEYSKDGSIKPKSSWFTQDDKPFRIFSNGLEWEESHVPVPDDDVFTRED